MRLLTDILRWGLALLLVSATMSMALVTFRTGFAAVAERIASWPLIARLAIWVAPGTVAVTVLAALVGRMFNGAALLVRQRTALLQVASTLWLACCFLWLVGHLLGPFAFGWSFLPDAWLSTTIFSLYLLWLAGVDFFALQLEADGPAEEERTAAPTLRG